MILGDPKQKLQACWVLWSPRGPRALPPQGILTNCSLRVFAWGLSFPICTIESGEARGEREEVAVEACWHQAFVSAEAGPFCKISPLQNASSIVAGAAEGAGRGLHFLFPPPRPSRRNEERAGCGCSAGPEWACFSGRRSPPPAGQLFAFCSRLAGPHPGPSSSFNACCCWRPRCPWCSLQMRSDTCTRRGQRGSGAWGDPDPGACWLAGRWASEAALINTILTSSAATEDKVEERL